MMRDIFRCLHSLYHSVTLKDHKKNWRDHSVEFMSGKGALTDKTIKGLWAVLKRSFQAMHGCQTKKRGPSRASYEVCSDQYHRWQFWTTSNRHCVLSHVLIRFLSSFLSIFELFWKDNQRKTIVNSWVRCLENNQLVITSGFPTVNFRKW